MRKADEIKVSLGITRRVLFAVFGIIDKRYWRRGRNDTQYLLNVLTAQSEAFGQGWFLLFKVTCLWMSYSGLIGLIYGKMPYINAQWGAGSFIIFLITGLAGFVSLHRSGIKLDKAKEDQQVKELEMYGIQYVINRIKG